MDDVDTPDRLAVFVKDGILEICIPESIFFDPVTQKGRLKKIYAGGVKIDGSKLDKQLLIKLFKKHSKKKLTHKELQEIEDKKLLEKYKVQGKPTKRKMKKATVEIQKYEQILSRRR